MCVCVPLFYFSILYIIAFPSLLRQQWCLLIMIMITWLHARVLLYSRMNCKRLTGQQICEQKLFSNYVILLCLLYYVNMVFVYDPLVTCMCAIASIPGRTSSKSRRPTSEGGWNELLVIDTLF